MKKFYVIREIYSGSDYQNFNADQVKISTKPATTNMSNEVRLHGWCGTTNDLATYAHGEYDTVESAVEHVKLICPDGYRELDEFDDEFGTVVAVYKMGRYETLDADATAEYIYDEVKQNVTSDMTAEQVQKLVDEWEASANADGFTLTNAFNFAWDYARI